MKRLILLLTISFLLLSCNNDSNTSGSNNGNSFTNSMDYEFTIKVNGEVHKVKGNTTNGIPYGYVMGSPFNYISNSCYSHASSLLYLGINDVTASNYISGQNLQCQIQFDNLLLGTNQARVFFSGGYFQTLATSLGADSTGFLFYKTTSGVSNSLQNGLLPINITDLGTPSTNPVSPPYTFGQTLKGNYSGTIYLQKTTLDYTIPVQLSIDFKVLRRY